MANVSRSRARVLNRLTVAISAFLIGAGLFSSSIPPLSVKALPFRGHGLAAIRVVKAPRVFD